MRADFFRALETLAAAALAGDQAAVETLAYCVEELDALRELAGERVWLESGDLAWPEPVRGFRVLE